jgi:hypothetical protein
MIIARDVKIVPRAAGEWDNTSSAITLFARVAYNIFSTIEQKKNEKKQRQTTGQSCASCVKNAINTHFLHDRRQMCAIKTLLHYSN